MFSPYDGAMKTNTAHPANSWRYVAGAWLALALFDASKTVITMHAMGMQHDWWTLFAVTGTSWAMWPCLTPVVLTLLRRCPLPSKAAAPWLVHGAACVAIGATWAAWSALLEHATNPFAYPAGADPFAPLWRGKFLGNLVGDIVLYGAIVTLSITLDAHRRLAQQQAAGARLAALLAQTQLAALRLQIEPHFIFNSLNAVTGLIRANKGNEAVTVIASLGDLMRRVTDHSECQFVAMADEVDFLRKYLEIQQLRFAERLRCRIEIPDALMTAQVPDFILQPLVENAVKHGIAKRARGGELCVSASLDGDGAVLTLSVYNDGPPLPVQVREGVGVANARRRLQALYGSAQTLTLQNRDGLGVLATVTLPYRQQ
jgi:signal transduction histidine kinase